MRYVELDTLTRWLLVNLIDLYIFYSKVGFLIFLHFRVSFGVQYILLFAAFLKSLKSNRKIDRGHHVLNNKQGCYKQGAKGLVSCISESVRIQNSIKGVISTKKHSYLPILLRYENN